MLKSEFHVGDRVRVRIATDVIPEDEIVCDIGFVESVRLVHAKTEFERIEYKIRLDGVYAKPKFLYAVGPKVTVSVGFNANEYQSITKVPGSGDER